MMSICGALPSLSEMFIPCFLFGNFEVWDLLLQQESQLYLYNGIQSVFGFIVYYTASVLLNSTAKTINILIIYLLERNSNYIFSLLAT
jgi:hypothetical protein